MGLFSFRFFGCCVVFLTCILIGLALEEEEDGKIYFQNDDAVARTNYEDTTQRLVSLRRPENSPGRKNILVYNADLGQWERVYLQASRDPAMTVGPSKDKSEVDSNTQEVTEGQRNKSKKFIMAYNAETYTWDEVQLS